MVFVRDVMTKSVIVIDPERTVLDAAKRMAAKRIGGLVVVKYGRPIGLVTDRDILWKVTSTGRNPSRVLVRDIMTSPVATVSPLTTLRAAARVMLEEETRWLVVFRTKVSRILRIRAPKGWRPIHRSMIGFTLFPT